MRIKDLVFPLLVLAFTALAVTFLQPVFTLTVRWAVLCVAFCWVVFNGCIFKPFNSPWGAVSLVFVGWCAITAGWSEVWQLSLMKTVASLLVVATGLAAGQKWVRDHSLRSCLSFIGPLAFVSTLAAVLGRNSARGTVVSGPTVMYQGMVNGPNMFGSMLAMCAPYLIWQTYSNWGNIRSQRFWVGLSLMLLVFLVMSRSRGAMLVVVCCLGGLFWTLRPGLRLQILVLGGAAGVIAFLATPQFIDGLFLIIYKAPDSSQSVFATRVGVWEESVELAWKGGLFGGGYGVTIGDSDWTGGLTAIGYGREKGNSQLAIMEEIGLIGLGLYFLQIAIGFNSAVQCLESAQPGAPKALVGIVSGQLFGMVIQSFFEAWWTAPGSPESVYFWTLSGVAVGMATDSRLRKITIRSGNRFALIKRRELRGSVGRGID